MFSRRGEGRPSASAADWQLLPPPPATRTLIEAGLPPRLAPLLARRGVVDPEAARRFLDPAAGGLHDPFLLHGMEAAVERLLRARARREKVAIVGDYDVDGVSGTAILVAVFRACGLEALAILPNRLIDGYGFREPQVERAKAAGCTLIVTVDCGTTSAAAVARSRTEGIDVIITDHHLPSPSLPADVVQINPRQEACSYPFPDLSGAGLAFKLALALSRRCERALSLEALLRIACLGTIADLVPLVGENRVIAALGLQALGRSRSHGLRALMRAAGIRPPLRADDVGFRLGPRLNAAGRLHRPDEALELLLTRDPQRAEGLARELDERNRDRQAEEQRVVVEARRLVARRRPLPGILVAWSSDWHPGVVGIAASRLARDFCRPTVLLASDGASSVGSGRSVPGIALHSFLARWESELERFGGHSQAVGLTVLTSRLEELKRRWELAAAEAWPAQLLRRHWEYEIEAQAGEVCEELLDELLVLQPHGSGNPHPVLRVGPLSLEGAPRVFGKGHCKAFARGEDGARVRLLVWNRDADEPPPVFPDRFEVLARLEWDSFDRAPVLEVLTSRHSAGPPGQGS